MANLTLFVTKSLYGLLWLMTTIGYSWDHYPAIIEQGFAKKADIKPTEPEPQRVASLCQKLGQKFKTYRWESNPCGKVTWSYDYLTADGEPILYWVYGQGPQKTLIISGTHPDEYTPVPMGFRLARHIHAHPEAIDPATHTVVIAPLINPDGFLVAKPTRVNGQGVDPNRNFPTYDWYAHALDWWHKRKYRSPRHFPGFFPNTEPETLAQVALIKAYMPHKIVSIHAPLGFLDYDGPGDRLSKVAHPHNAAEQLAHAMAKKSRNYRVVDYSYYPGSLGNYAGNGLKIPTVTLELKTIDPHKVDHYWKQFLPGILHSIEFAATRIGQSPTGDKKL